MLLSLGLFLLVLSGLHAESEVKEVQAMVGSDVALSCIHPNQSHFDLNDLFVYWQISDVPPIVVTYYLSENKSEDHGDSQYKNRAHMLQDRMKQGDFSLYLRNVTPQDTQKFECLVFWKSTLTRALKKEVRLHVAANFSMPVVRSSPSQGRELTFTCMSRNGYPKPNLYWINRTDNSLIAETLQNSTVSLNEHGLYDVVSILRIPWALDVDVGCCVENVVLQQNLTSISQAETSSGKKDLFTENPQRSHEDRNMALFSILAILLVAAVVTFAWVCRSKCPQRSYAGAQTVVVEQELIDHA